MTSAKYNVYRYRYESDNGNFFIREQRVFINSVTNQEIIPVTGVFLNAAVSLPQEQRKIKAEKFNNKERRAEVSYRNAQNQVTTTNRYIPFNDSTTIKNQLNEQKQDSTVLCLDYIGESRDYQLSKFV